MTLLAAGRIACMKLLRRRAIILPSEEMSLKESGSMLRKDLLRTSFVIDPRKPVRGSQRPELPVDVRSTKHNSLSTSLHQVYQL